MSISILSTGSHVGAALGERDRFYRPELDTLRFLAFLAVFVFHGLPSEAAFFENAGLPPQPALVVAKVVQAGAFGVDLFFCLSAYLITSLLVREFERTGLIELRSFYIRRALRIWPLYGFAILLLLIAWPLLGFGDFSLQRVLAFAFFAGNWFMAFGGGGGEASHLWSISFEEQFYILWPLAVFLLGVSRIGAIAVAMLAAASLGRAIAIHLDAEPLMRWTNTFLRLDPLAVGALLAVALPRGFALEPRLRPVVFLAGGAVPVICLLTLELNTVDDLLIYPLIALGCGLLLVAALQPAPEGLMANRYTVHLGKISYGLYVFHPLGLVICGALLDSGGFVSGLVLTMAFAMISYRFLETPFLRLKERFTTVRSRPV